MLMENIFNSSEVLCYLSTLLQNNFSKSWTNERRFSKHGQSIDVYTTAYFFSIVLFQEERFEINRYNPFYGKLSDMYCQEKTNQKDELMY